MGLAYYTVNGEDRISLCRDKMLVEVSYLVTIHGTLKVIEHITEHSFERNTTISCHGKI
jgi:hypothetical protein